MTHTMLRGVPLDPATLAAVRSVVTTGGSRRLAEICGASRSAIDRAASGSPVLKGTAALLRIAVAQLRELGELPKVVDDGGGPRAA
jgi:hypothetical protein